MDWTTLITATVTAIGAAGASMFGAWFLFRTKKVEVEAKGEEVEANATDAFLKGQTAFQAYVDSVVDKRVAVAVDGLAKQMHELELRLEEVIREADEVKAATRLHQTQLWLWNLAGRQGRVPMLPEAMLEKLGLTHLMHTFTNPTPTTPQ